MTVPRFTRSSQGAIEANPGMPGRCRNHLAARPDHAAEDLRSIAAVERFRTVYGPDWPVSVPSLARRLYNHVACGDCPLGRRQAGAAAHLIERPA